MWKPIHEDLTEGEASKGGGEDGEGKTDGVVEGKEENRDFTEMVERVEPRRTILAEDSMGVFLHFHPSWGWRICGASEIEEKGERGKEQREGEEGEREEEDESLHETSHESSHHSSH